jgi:hypothetical protein
MMERIADGSQWSDRLRQTIAGAPVTPRSVDLCALPHVPSTCVHDLARRLRCMKCGKAGKRPQATLYQLAQRKRHQDSEA